MAKERILVIEDEDALREILIDVLTDEGYEVSDTSSCRDALVRAKKTFFNVVLGDLRLRDGDGLKTLAQIKETWQDTCAIVMTGYTSAETAVAALEQGIYDYLSKPLNMERVKEVIARGIERQRFEIENRRLLVSLKKENERLEVILQVGEMASSILNLGELSRSVVTRIGEIIPCDKVSLLTLDEDGYLTIKAAKGLDEEIIKNTRIRPGESISGWVAQEARPLLIKDIEIDPLFHKRPDPKYKSRSFISIPLIYRGKVSGVINAMDKLDQPLFCDEDVRLISAVAHYLAIAIENARLYEEKSRLAITDGLTGIYNHRYFKEHLEEEFRRARRFLHPFSLIMIDIDHFKEYNDRYGHLGGDLALKTVADTLMENIREVDIVSRYGGEEFTIILPDTDIEGAEALAEKARRAVKIKSLALAEAGQEGLTISAGVASFKISMKDLDELIDQADKALYQAKQEGRDRTRVYKE